MQDYPFENMGYFPPPRGIQLNCDRLSHSKNVFYHLFQINKLRTPLTRLERNQNCLKKSSSTYFIEDEMNFVSKILYWCCPINALNGVSTMSRFKVLNSDFLHAYFVKKMFFSFGIVAFITFGSTACKMRSADPQGSGLFDVKVDVHTCNCKSRWQCGTEPPRGDVDADGVVSIKSIADAKNKCHENLIGQVAPYCTSVNPATLASPTTADCVTTSQPGNGIQPLRISFQCTEIPYAGATEFGSFKRSWG
jgi:hypothetical protein